MGPRSSDRGYVVSAEASPVEHAKASMGPRSSDRGYEPYRTLEQRLKWLQWVHGPQTVVMERRRVSVNVKSDSLELQWVHGPQTVVMQIQLVEVAAQEQQLQWVHGPQTVVMYQRRCENPYFSGASMGPRSSDRGYGRSP